MFPSSTDVSTRRVSPVITFSGIRSLHRVGKPGWPLAETVLYPGDEFTRRYLNSFRENQLSPGLIGLSPQPQVIR